MFVHVTISNFTENQIAVTLADGTVVHWERTGLPDHWAGRQVGDQLILTLTQETDILNELLSDQPYVNPLHPSPQTA